MRTLVILGMVGMPVHIFLPCRLAQGVKRGCARTIDRAVHGCVKAVMKDDDRQSHY